MFIDCHSHIFLNEHIPDNLFYIDSGYSDKTVSWVSKLLHWIIPCKGDKLENLSSITKHLSTETMESIFLELLAKYPADAKVCVLPLDLRGINGKIDEKYEVQIQKLLKLKEKYPEKMLIFMHLDPNQIEFLNWFWDYVLINKVDGIKIYPSLDSCPTHPRFNEIWGHCVKKKIPIISHNSTGGLTSKNYFYRSKTKLSNPKHWCKVLEKHPNLYLDLAHFGNGNSKWSECVIDLCKNFPNVYSDVSFYFLEDKNIDALANYLQKHDFLQHKMLYGSDFYISDLYSFDIDRNIEYLKDKVGNDVWKKMTCDNPKRFLSK